MNRAVLILALTIAAAVAAPAFAEPDPAAVAPGGAGERFSALVRGHPAGGDGLATGVEELLTRDPASATDIARQAKRLNCDQAAAVALGVSRAIAASKRTDRDRVKKIYQPFEQACSNCSRGDRGRRETPSDDGRGMCRVEEGQDYAQPNKIRNARGEDCFCSLVAGLAAQAYAQGDAGERMGFFADELSGNGGAGGLGRWIGFPVSGN
jgi:hypothetical protein